MENTITVCITGAAGQIAYSLIPQLLRGIAFPDKKIDLRLMDIEVSQNTLKGVTYEI